MLQRLMSEGMEYSAATSTSAAAGGQLETLKWLRSLDPPCPCSTWVCNYAAEKGDLEMLQWAREEGCPWEEMACMMAARGGHLEVLQWLRSQRPPCPWHRRVCWDCADDHDD